MLKKSVSTMVVLALFLGYAWTDFLTDLLNAVIDKQVLQCFHSALFLSATLLIIVSVFTHIFEKNRIRNILVIISVTLALIALVIQIIALFY